MVDLLVDMILETHPQYDAFAGWDGALCSGLKGVLKRDYQQLAP